MALHRRQIQLASGVLVGATVMVWLVLSWIRFHEESVELDGVAAQSATEQGRSSTLPMRSEGPGAASKPQELPANKDTAPSAGEDAKVVHVPLVFKQGGNVIITVMRRDKSAPVFGLHVELRPRKRLATDLLPLIRKTDQHGQVTFPAQPARMYDVTVIEGGRRSHLLVHEDTVTEKTLILNKLRTVQGICVDENDAPVAGATISAGYLTFDVWSRAEVAVSDSQGRFTIPAISNRASLEARKDWMAPAEMARVTALRGGNSRLRLRLGSDGAGLSGNVTAYGKPVANACVMVSDSDDDRPSESHLGDAITTQTDDHGFYSFNNIRRGAVVLRVIDSQHAEHIARYVLDGRSNQQNINLVRGATIRGHLSAPDGRNAGFSTVAATGSGGLWRVRAESDPRGYFELLRVPPGPAALEAVESFHGTARESHTLSDGQVLNWSPSFSDTSSIKGRVIFEENGQGVSHVRVKAEFSGPPSLTKYYGRSADTKVDGSFELSGVKAGEHTLSFSAYGEQWSYPSKKSGEIIRAMPGQAGIEIRVKKSKYPSAWVYGSVRSAAGELDAYSMIIRPVGDDNPEPNFIKSRLAKAFEFGPFVPGEYYAEVHVHRYGVRQLGTFRINGEERLNLGTILMAEPGQANVQFDGFKPRVIQKVEFLQNGRVVKSFESDSSFCEVRHLQPGRYKVVVREGQLLRHTDLVIRSGATTDITVSAR